jgi:hypothetical protein
MTTHLDGQVDLASTKEAQALPSTTDVASFTDANLSDAAGDFTATIVWGDGTTTTNATVMGSNGSFTVEGGHTYNDEGSFAASVTIVRNADNSQLVLNGDVAVADADTLTPQNTPTITGNPNQALTNVVVAKFTDSNTANVVGDFTVSIDWGDGTTTAGTLTGSNGVFTVTGSHTYAAAGQYTITTFMGDDAPDAAFNDATTTAAIGFGGNETLQSATETIAVTSGTQVATFVDNTGLPAGDYTATIDWGDGQTTNGVVSGSNGSFIVTTASDHAYADEGNFTLTATITRTTDHTTTAASGTVTVAEDDVISAAGTTIHNGPTLTDVTVATFTDSDTLNVAADFLATIDWGDGTTSTGTVSGGNGAFTVSGSHTYAHGGQDTITVNVADDPADGQATAADSTTTTAMIIGLEPGSASAFSATEGSPIGPTGSQVATFSDGNTSDNASDFTATINWGDGTTDTGTISGSNGSFTVTTAGHTYADEGTDTITTTVTRTSDNEQVAMTGQATVGEADSLTVTGDGISGHPGLQLSSVQVATFTDSTYPGNVPGDFAALVNWGDGTTSTGTISETAQGSYTVDGSHAYATAGNYSLTVTVLDDAPGTAVGTGTGSAAIHGAGGWLAMFTSTPPSEPDGWLTGVMQTSAAADHPQLFIGTAVDGGNVIPIAGTLPAPGPGFDSNSDPIAGPAPSVLFGMPIPLQTHTG